MHKFKTTFIAFAFLLFVGCTWAQEPRDEAKPPQNEKPAAEEHSVNPPAHHEEARPPRQQEEAKPPREEKPGRQQEEAKPPKERNEARPANEQHGQERSQQAQQGQHARPRGKSQHIPDQKFRASFGHEHHFTVNRIINTTTIVPNQTQFVISGFTFVFLDPWPVDWAFTDDCFIDFVDDDYFLFDALHPGIRVALFVVG